MVNAYRQQETSLTNAQGSSDDSKPLTRFHQGQPFFNKWRLGFLAVLVISIVAYLPSLGGLKIWDDDALLDGSGIGGGANALHALSHPFLGAYFRPLVSLSFYFENKLWNGVPFYYHQTNILLHMLACAALIGFVLTAFGNRRLALLSGLLFAVQPAQVSTVAWIGGRTDSLCALLVIVFAYALLLGVRAAGWHRFAWIGVSTVFFFLAAITKEQIVALLPLAPFAVKAFSQEDSKPDFRTYTRITVPYVLASALFAVLWVIYNPNPYKAYFGGPGDQLTTAGHTAVYYTLLFALPAGKWMHTLSLGSLQTVGWPSAVAGLALLLAFAAALWLLIKRDAKMGWIGLLAALALLPVANLIPLPSLLVAPYRAGVAGVGVAVLLAWIGLRMSRNAVMAALGLAFVVWCAWLTVWGAAQWKDPVTLFSRITAEDPYSIVARRNIASYLLKVGKPQASIDQMTSILTMLYGTTSWQDPNLAYEGYKTNKALARKVEENQGNEVLPDAWLGELFAQLGFAEAQNHDFKSSRSSFAAAVRIDPSNARSRVGLAQFALFDGKPALALRNLRIASAAHPGDPQLYGLLANVYGQTGRLNLAEKAYRQSIAIEPWFGPTYQDLAEVQAKQGDIKGAIVTLKAALNCTVLDANGINKRIDELQRLDLKGGSHAA